MEVINTKYAINRIKSMNYYPIVAFWSENGVKYNFYLILVTPIINLEIY